MILTLLTILQIQTGEPIEFERPVSGAQLQIQPPVELVGESSVTSWTPGHYPISFVMPDGSFSPVTTLTVLPPPKPEPVDLSAYLQELLPVPSSTDSLLSSENQALLDHRREEAKEGSSNNPVRYLPWLALGLLPLLYFLRKNKITQVEVVNPLERALEAFGQLQSKELPDKGEFQEYYVELTNILRHYIEGGYEIRAPEQTTEEFLHSLQNHSTFPDSTRDQLSRFMSSADRVKFACHQPQVADCHTAGHEAKEFLEAEREHSHLVESR